jgi:hypothetical protein
MIRKQLLHKDGSKKPNWVKNEEGKLVEKMLEALYYKDEYLVKHGYKDEGYGTPEDDNANYESLDTLESETSIRNVEDMHLALKDLLRTDYFQQMNTELFKTYTKIGDMHIYMDGSRSLQYIPVSEKFTAFKKGDRKKFYAKPAKP